jgi:hypothetical protein
VPRRGYPIRFNTPGGVRNVSKYTDAGGRISLAARSRARRMKRPRPGPGEAQGGVVGTASRPWKRYDRRKNRPGGGQAAPGASSSHNLGGLRPTSCGVAGQDHLHRVDPMDRGSPPASLRSGPRSGRTTRLSAAPDRGGQVVRPLEPVGCGGRPPCTPGPSTWSSSRGLRRPLDARKPCFGGGFALRCLQRLSFPGLATRRCPERDSRYTRGRSSPILSY